MCKVNRNMKIKPGPSHGTASPPEVHLLVCLMSGMICLICFLLDSFGDVHEAFEVGLLEDCTLPPPYYHGWALMST